MDEQLLSNMLKTITRLTRDNLHICFNNSISANLHRKSRRYPLHVDNVTLGEESAPVLEYVTPNDCPRWLHA